MIEEIENYLYSINIEMLSLEELEHLTKTIIAIEEKKLNDLERKENKLKEK